MNDILSQALGPVILIYVISGMLALGLGQTVSQIFTPLRRLRLTLSAVLASYLILPLACALIARLFGLEQGLRYGLVLMAMSAGAEVGPLLAAVSKANVRLAGGLLVLSIVITIVYLPIMLGVFLPDAEVPVVHLLVKLTLTIIVPLVLGLLIKWRFERFAHRIEHWMHTVSRIFVVLLTLLVIVLFAPRIAAMVGNFAVLSALISVLGGLGLGYLLGGPDRGDRLAMGYMHGARSASIAVMVANDLFSDDPKVMLMIATQTLLILTILLPLSYLLKAEDAAAGSSPDGVSAASGS